MKVKLNKELSSLVEYQNNPGIYYLHGVFTPYELNPLQIMGMGTDAQYIMNVYPNRNSGGTINEIQAKWLKETFENGSLFNETFFVERFKIAVEPFVMRRSSDSQYGRKGEIIMDGAQPKLYDYVRITTFSKVVDGKEVSVLDDTTLRNRALSVKNFRIKNGDWIDATEYAANMPAKRDEEPSDENAPEPLTEDKTAALEAELARLKAARK